MPEHHSHPTGSGSGGGRPQLQIDPGCSDFRSLREQRCYYVDKTARLPQLLRGRTPLLLTRPRRFGKTLTLDTMRRFLELDYHNPGDTAAQQQLFAGLAIMENPDLQECRERFMGQYPVLALSFNTVEGESFEGALFKVRDVVAPLYDAFRPFLEAAGAIITEDMHFILHRYYRIGCLRDRSELEELLPMALPRLCQMLYRIYARPVYILIDEYDTPLARAWSAARLSASQAGKSYYSAMADLMRGLLQPLLKPQPAAQDSIARCICTGCTRISRESLFSGTNNLSVLDCDDPSTATLMGFTEDEVQDLLSSCGLTSRMAAVRKWYNGYQFGGVRIYNPWSIAKYCQSAILRPNLRPGNYWVHSSANDELAACLQAMSGEDLEQLQQLCVGGRAVLPILSELSYEELLARGDSTGLFTLLYHAGYLTRDNAPSSPQWRMRIPNTEVRKCFEQQILGMYEPLAAGRGEVSMAPQLCSALLRGRPQEAQGLLERLLERYLSFHALAMRSGALDRLEKVLAARCDAAALQDFRVIDDRRAERIYQIYAAGVLCTLCPGQITELGIEQELGEGYADLSFIAAGDGLRGCVLEFKKAADVAPGRDGERYALRVQEACLKAAREGLDQIAGRGYASGLMSRYALQEVQAYGIGCAGKRCTVEWRRYGRDVP